MPLRVRELQAHDRSRCAILQRLLERQPVLRRLLDHALDVAAAQQPADEVGLAVLLADVEHGDDVRVRAEAAHRLRLARDALARRRRRGPRS